MNTGREERGGGTAGVWGHCLAEVEGAEKAMAVWEGRPGGAGSRGNQEIEHCTPGSVAEGGGWVQN